MVSPTTTVPAGRFRLPPPESPSSLRALRHRQFAVFWLTAIVSNSANFMQQLTVPFIVFELTDSNTWVGAVAFAALIPGVVLTPVSGVLADRLPRRTIILVTLSVQTLVATGFLVLWLADALTPWRIVILSLINGVVVGTQIAAWQSLVPLLVPRHDLLAAVRLNSAGFTASRALGPMVGAGLLAAIGPASVFFANAATFVLLLAVVVKLRPRQAPAAPPERIATVFRSGFAYVRARGSMLLAVATGFTIAFFGMSLVQIAAGLAKEDFGVGKSGLAGLVTATGIGSVLSSIVIISGGDAFRRSRMALGGLVVYGLGPLIIVSTTNYIVGLAGFLVLGAAHVTVAIALNTALQIQVAEEMRGRVISIYMMGVIGGLPVGAFVGGRLGDLVGLRTVYVGAGIFLLAYSLLAALVFDRLGALDDEHTEPVPATPTAGATP